MTHYNLVHKCFPMPQAMKIPDAKAAVVKEWKKLVEFGKSKGGFPGSRKRQQYSPLCLMLPQKMTR